MLTELIESGFGNKQDYNCAEKILYGANQAYDLNMSQNDMKVASAFGGGMGIEAMCGAITGGLMVIGILFTEVVQHQSPKVRELSDTFLNAYREKMSDLACKPLKKKYRTEEYGCHFVILEAAILLDEIYKNEVLK